MAAPMEPHSIADCVLLKKNQIQNFLSSALMAVAVVCQWDGIISGLQCKSFSQCMALDHPGRIAALPMTAFTMRRGRLMAMRRKVTLHA